MRSSTAIWFDVYTRAANPVNNPYGTLDTDGLSQYAETRTYGSDPFDSDSDDDAQMPNGNGINDRLEVLYGLDPTEKPDTAGGTEDYDPTSANTVDDDGINFGAEAQFGGRPDQQDIFVEVDWMADASHDHKPSERAIDYVMKPFAIKNIRFHLDDGIGSYVGSSPQGGPISHYKDYLYFGIKAADNSDSPSGSGQFNDFYDVKAEHFNKFKNGNPTDRSEIFHYVIFGHRFSWFKDGQEREGKYKAAGTGIHYGGNFFIGDKRIREINSEHISGQQANTFMHELGHAIGLEEYDGGSKSSMGGAPSTRLGYGTAWDKLDLDLYL